MTFEHDPPVLDLTTCDREPIHIPGTIQPHGIMFGCSPGDLRLSAISANAGKFFGLENAGDLLTVPLSQLLDKASFADVSALPGIAATNGPRLTRLRLSGSAHLLWRAKLHATEDQILLEAELSQSDGDADPLNYFEQVETSSHRILAAHDVTATVQRLVEAVQHLTGYDRVKLYRFAADWSGEVIAEATNGAMPSYLGLHFPASDIPVQARNLYARNLKRQIPDVAYAAVPILRQLPGPLDLSDVGLRSVSPVHIEYLKNMGVGASMSLSIIHKNRLWGLVACHHATAHYVAPERRAASLLLVQSAAGRLALLEGLEIARRTVALKAIETNLIEQGEGEDYQRAIGSNSGALLDLLGASGLVVSLGKSVATFGGTPDATDLRRLLDWLSTRGADLQQTDHLAGHYPAGPSLPCAAGVLSVSLGGNPENLLVWLRSEYVRTVTWAGDPVKPADRVAGEERLTPRHSFDAWSEQVHGRSRPWTPDELAAASSLRSTIVDIIIRRSLVLGHLNTALGHTNRKLEVSLRQAREAESRFRLAQEAADLGIWDWDLINQSMEWSPRQRAMFAMDPDGKDPVRGTDWRLSIHPEDRDAVAQTLATAIANITPFETLFRVVCPECQAPPGGAGIRWLAGKGIVLADSGGKAVRVLGVSVDVTDQQNAIAGLKASRSEALADLYLAEKRFQTYFDSSSDALSHIRLLPGGRFVYEAMNTAALATTGHIADAVEGRTPEDVFGPEIGGTITTALRQVCKTGSVFRFQPSFTIGAEETTLDAVYLPLRDRNSVIVGILCSSRDITETRRRQAAEHHVQKMDVIGRMAAGVAHDFNNILQSISGSLELLQDELPAASIGLEFTTIARGATQRGSELTHHLLSYARKQLLQPRQIDLAELLASVELLLQRTLVPGITVVMHQDPAATRLHADPGQVETALLNLAVNAAQAMPNGGTIRIDCTIIADDRMAADGQAWVCITVTDTGTGMDEGTLARAVEPFFSTRGPMASGLGLSMVQGFAEQSKGKLAITSKPGRGTTAALYLPVPIEAVNISAAPVSPTLRHAAVLLVDDDPDVLLTTWFMLDKANFTIIRASSGTQALAVLACGTRIDAIVTDYAMPGMNGSELVSEARGICPGLPAIIITGFSDLTDTYLQNEEILTLRKPFNRNVLISTLHRLVEAHHDAAAMRNDGSLAATGPAPCLSPESSRKRNSSVPG